MAPEFTCITYDPRYKNEYRTLNERWISEYFKIEPKDTEQLCNPEECRDDGGEIFFIVHNGEAVGTCAVYKMDNGVYELAKMAVHPNYQGRGLSNTLMEQSEAWVKEQGGREMLIRSNRVLTPAITLYRKHGYIEIPMDGADPEYARCNISMKKPI